MISTRINTLILVFFILLPACGYETLKSQKPVNTQIDDELNRAKQKTKDEEEKLEDAKRTLDEAKKKAQSEIDKSGKNLAASIEDLRKAKIPLIQTEIGLLEKDFQKAKVAFNNLANRRSKTDVLKLFFDDNKKPTDQVLNALDDNELTNILNDLQDILAAVFVK